MDEFCEGEGSLCSRCSRNSTRSQAVKWCRRCGESLCEHCISIHRRDTVSHTHKVTNLPERSDKLSPLYQISENLKAEKSKLETKIEEVSTLIATNKSKLDSLVFDHTRQQQLIRDIFQKINEEINERERLLLHHLDDAIGKEMGKVPIFLQFEETRLQLYQQSAHLIDKAVTSGFLVDIHKMCEVLLTAEMAETGKTKQPMLNHVKYYVNSDDLMKQLKELDFGFIQALSDSKPRLAEFNSSRTIECRLLNDMGTPSVNNTTVLDVKGIHTQDSKPGLAEFESSGTIECRLSDDKDVPSIHDITVMNVGGIPCQVSKLRLAEFESPGTIECRLLNDMGTPSVNNTTVLDVKGIHKQDSKLRLAEFESSGTIECRLSDDKDVPSIHDITVLEIKGIRTLVITDPCNKCVKSFYTFRSKALHSRLPLDNQPFGVTGRMKDMVMVAVQDSRQIVTLAVTPNLKRRSVIHTREGYISLAVIGDNSVAAGGDDCVDILNMDGEVLKSLSTQKNPLFSYPAYMCVSYTGNLLVSDSWEKRVTCLTTEGEVLWTYTGAGEEHLLHPRGISETRAGHILVGDMGSDKLILLSKSGEIIGDNRTSTDGLRHPRCICVDKNDSLFVCDIDRITLYSTVQISSSVVK